MFREEKNSELCYSYKRLIKPRIKLCRRPEIGLNDIFKISISFFQVVVYPWEYWSNVPPGEETFMAAWPCCTRPLGWEVVNEIPSHTYVYLLNSFIVDFTLMSG